MSKPASLLGSAVKTAAATAVFAVVHSGLASLSAQNVLSDQLGERQRRGLFRSLYIAQSFLCLIALGLYLGRLPDRRLYRVTGGPALLLRLGQAASLAFATAAAYRVGLARITGLASFSSWFVGSHWGERSIELTGADEDPLQVEIEPAAQGPSLDARGRLQTGWPFSWSRHPLNFAPLPVFWLNPHMTLKLLAFNLVASLYLVIGSVHEERRLLARYGAQYQAYRESGVSFYLPRPR